MIDQIGIALTGCIAIALTNSADDETRKYAPIFGLLAQPLWFYSSYIASQWGVFAMTFVYTAAWAKGAHHYWIKRKTHVTPISTSAHV